MNKISLGTFFKICGLFLISRLLIIVSFFIALHSYGTYSVRGNNFNYCSNKILNCLGCWDSGRHLYVAGSGYVADSHNQTNYGFFPFYPMAMKAVAIVVHNTFIAGIIVSNILLFAGSVFLFLLSLRIFRSNSTALLVVAILYFYPGSYLLSGVFSEPSFICFSIMCFYFFETDNYLLSGISGFLLTLTRPFGVLILPPLFIAYLFKHGATFRVKNLWLILIPLGTFSFFAYCYFTTGDFFYYVHAKQQGWKTEYSNPWDVLSTGLKIADNLYVRFNSAYALFWLILSVFLSRYVPFYLFVWVLILIVAPLFNGPVNLICMPRYMVVCFPLFMMVAAFTKAHKWGWIFIFLLAGVNLILSGFFALGYQFTA